MSTPGGGSGGSSKVGKEVTEEVNGVVVRGIDRDRTVELGEGASKKEMAIALYGQPLMRIIGGIADKWERVAKCV